MKATIVATKIFPPKPGKKRSTIVDERETLWGAMPSIASKMQVGGTYDVEYKEDHFAGKTYLVIEGVWPVAGASPAPQPAPAAEPLPVAPSASYTTKYGNQDMATAERIFVCGALNAILSNQNVAPGTLGTDDIVGYVFSLRESWKLTFGRPVTPVVTRARVESGRNPNDDMDDEIPPF